MNKLSNAKQALLEELKERVGVVVSRQQVLSYIKARGGSIADVRFIFNNKVFRAGRGQYDLTAGAAVVESPVVDVVVNVQ